MIQLSKLVMLVLFYSCPIFCRSIEISVIPREAKIVVVDTTGNAIKTLGVGSLTYNLRRSDNFLIRAELDGFTPSDPIRIDKRTGSTVQLELNEWAIQFEGHPSDAIFAIQGNGDRKGPFQLRVRQGETIEVELKKAGYKSVFQELSFNSRGLLPPFTRRRLELKDWQFVLNTTPGSIITCGRNPYNGSVIVESGKQVNIHIEKSGYEPIDQSYYNGPDEQPPGDQVDLFFNVQLVNVIANSSEDVIATEPEQLPISHGNKTIKVHRGRPTKIKVTKPGYEVFETTFTFKDNAEPEFRVRRLQPIVEIRVTRPKDAQIFINGVLSNSQPAFVPLPDRVETNCYTVRIEKPGYVPLVDNICNNNRIQTFELLDRLVNVSVSPENARILLEGREISTGLSGTREVKVRNGQSIRLRAQAPGYLRSREYAYENRDGELTPDEPIMIILQEDPAYSATIVAEELVNKDYPLVVNSQIIPRIAFNTIKEVILHEFQSLEEDDINNGKLLSTWIIVDFGPTVVRTRIRVQYRSDDPLTFNAQIESEHGEKPDTSDPSREIIYKPYPRLLPKYRNMIREMANRLR